MSNLQSRVSFLSWLRFPAEPVSTSGTTKNHYLSGYGCRNFLVAVWSELRHNPRMLRRIRLVVSCFFTVLCLVAVSLWIRSPFYKTHLYIYTSHHAVIIGEARQRFSINYSVYPRGVGVQGIQVISEKIERPRTAPNPQFNLRRGYFQDGYGIMAWLPCWFGVLLLGTCATAIRPKPRWQFSLMDLITLTTVAAVTVGTLMSLLRFWPVPGQ